MVEMLKIFTTLVLIASFVFSASLVHAQGVTLRIFPSQIYGHIGDEFSVSIMVDNSPDLSAYDLKIIYPTQYLDLLNMTATGTDLGGRNFVTALNNVNGSSGEARYSIALLGNSFSGNGSILKVFFKVTGIGQGEIGLKDDVLLDAGLSEISHSDQNSVFSSQTQVSPPGGFFSLFYSTAIISYLVLAIIVVGAILVIRSLYPPRRKRKTE